MGNGTWSHDWAVDFHRLYDQAVEGYRNGIRRPEELFGQEETDFLRSIGCTAQEIFDFAEDKCRLGEPSFETVLLITSARRDFFLFVQDGKQTGHEVSMDSLPPKEAQLGGYAWLPRILVKARAKLRGEMPSDLMYGCAGDRAFLRPVNIHPADFLREVWAAGDDDERVLRFVRRCAARSVAPGPEVTAGAVR